MQPTASLHYKVTNNSEANNYSLGLRLAKEKMSAENYLIFQEGFVIIINKITYA